MPLNHLSGMCSVNPQSQLPPRKMQTQKATKLGISGEMKSQAPQRQTHHSSGQYRAHHPRQEKAQSHRTSQRTGKCLKKSNMYLPSDPAIPRVNMHPKMKAGIHTKTFTGMFIAAFFVIIKNLDQP